MKKKAMFIVMMIFIIFTLCGCSKDSYQFEEPKKGDTVAEIRIKDFGSIYVRFFEKEAPKAV